MRHYDIAYVKQGTTVSYPAKPLQEMSLEEIKNKYLKACAKSNGNVSVCSKCQSPCEQGKRAIQLIANQIYNDPPIPLYGGKTLIERAKEENMLRRQRLEEEKKKQEEVKMEPKVEKRRKQYVEGWWEDSLKAEDQVAWVMQRFNMTKTQARKKIYAYRYHNGLTDKTYLTKDRKKSPVMTHEEVQAIVNNTPQKTELDNIESKMDALMKLQEKHKNIMIEMEQQYLKAKASYDAISKKIDILCTAMDIMNE